VRRLADRSADLPILPVGRNIYTRVGLFLVGALLGFSHGMSMV